MNKKAFHRSLLAAAVAMLILVTRVPPVLAHGHTTVGDYELVIGFHNEPAYQGEPNGLDLFVTDTQTDERVNGLENSLRAEIIFGSSSRELELEPQFGQEGAYTAHIFPTEAGDYTWHIWGDIEGTPLDVTMSSGPDTFGSVEPKSNVAFPGTEAGSDLESRAAAAERTAQVALIAGIAGVVAGVIGIAVAAMALRARRQPAV